VFPVKSLDASHPDAVEITAGGTFALDRAYAIVARESGEPYDPDEASPHGDYVNGKRTAAVHRLRSAFDPEAETVTLRVAGATDAERFDIPSPELDTWLSDYFDEPVSVRAEPVGGHPDHRHLGLTGPSVISTATLREVASWFETDTIDIDSIRRRFRANVEVDGVPPFWEDRLFADHGEAVAFRIGNVRLHGVEPCERCVVPTRDPDTGDETDGFRERFIRKRRATRPEWLESDRFDHDFRLMVITDIPESDRDGQIEVGDSVEVLGTRQYRQC
jgi:hypothetical protein